MRRGFDVLEVRTSTINALAGYVCGSHPSRKERG